MQYHKPTHPINEMKHGFSYAFVKHFKPPSQEKYRQILILIHSVEIENNKSMWFKNKTIRYFEKDKSVLKTSEIFHFNLNYDFFPPSHFKMCFPRLQ